MHTGPTFLSDAVGKVSDAVALEQPIVPLARHDNVIGGRVDGPKAPVAALLELANVVRDVVALGRHTRAPA